MKRLVFLSLVTLALQACASTDANDSPFVWRRATVVRVGEAATLGPSLAHDCRPRTTADGAPENMFAIVQYFSGRNSVVQIVPLEAGENFTAGDRIEISRLGCRKAHRPAVDTARP